MTLAQRLFERDYTVMGTRLGHTAARLDQLRHDNSRDSQARNFQMLLEWRQKQQGSPDTLQSRLVEALKAVERMDLVAMVTTPARNNGRHS